MTDPYRPPKGSGLKRDKYWKASSDALRDADAELARAQSDLAAYVNAGDRESAAACVSELAGLSRQRENIALLRQQYAQTKVPQQAPPQSREQWQHKPPEAMTAADAFEVFRTSKAGADLDFRNKDVQAGYQEAMRARGE